LQLTVHLHCHLFYRRIIFNLL